MVKLKFIRLVYFIISFISLNIVFPTTITVRNGIHFINFGFFKTFTLIYCETENIFDYSVLIIPLLTSIWISKKLSIILVNKFHKN
ncbi:Uncharacterised protein [Clostridium perfringens]|nr:hypothetical protein [Clostridium perfringens]STB42080.1 Uncharacterised protein [Clostridium perfringens]